MDGFSGTLRLTDLNDFIAPTQECIKPVQIERRPGKAGAIKISSTGDYSEVDTKGRETKLVKAAITLNDCLACSGCVTSAETVLVQQQSTEELCRVLDENTKVPLAEQKTVVLSVSSQSIASLGARYKLSSAECLEKTTGFFKSLGVNRVFELSPACALSLRESMQEFLNRYRSKDVPHALPMLSSACPGWICYAEKTHGSFILPYISTTKSPQQAMGNLVKNYFAEREGLSPDRIFHATLMMCYDKKLEASRDDFYDDVYKTRDVDLVVTSVEVEQMLEKRSMSLNDFPSLVCDALPGLDDATGHYEGNAGGYFEFIFRSAAEELFHEHIENLEYKVIRNKDFRELTLGIQGEPRLRFAVAYGFRNIQNIVQKMKRGKCPYDFVEIMACPSACVNGGGQIRPPEGEDAKSWLERVEKVYHESENNALSSGAPWLDRLYVDWLGGPDSGKSLKMLHTQYHSLENKSLNLNIKW